MRLKNKVAIVTGSTKGIGRAIAFGYAAEGANLVIVSRNQQQCDETAAAIQETYGVEAIGIKTDVTRIDEIKALMAKTVERFGKMDILVNNAGSAITQKAELITPEEWMHVLNLDLTAAFFCSQQAALVMMANGGGRIINIASMLGLVAMKNVAPYCAAKGGLIQLTRALALEWAKHGITVNALCPGYVITDINKDTFSDEKLLRSFEKRTAVNRLATADEMVEPAVFLAQENNQYMTGQALVIDGGWTIQ
jgi:NAD(P)-dependent dehydrogenase (short-subunit alcohol dehydrogenase family)